MSFIKENLNRILLLILISLIFVLWGRMMSHELKTNIYIKELTTLQKRISCVESFGWQPDIGSEVYENHFIPNSFDSAYIEYNRIQKMCGFDLTKHKGSSAIKYTYRVTNFPQIKNAEAYVHILIKDNNLIGGGCTLPALENKILPLYRQFNY